jgi:hypothetical protein
MTVSWEGKVKVLTEKAQRMALITLILEDTQTLREEELHPSFLSTLDPMTCQLTTVSVST